jgi:hypothetical protein
MILRLGFDPNLARVSHVGMVAQRRVQARQLPCISAGAMSTGT